MAAITDPLWQAANNHTGDLMVAMSAVHDACNFISLTLDKLSIDGDQPEPRLTSDANLARCAPIKLAVQALLTARISRWLSYDTFMAEFRDPSGSRLAPSDVADVIALLRRSDEAEDEREGGEGGGRIVDERLRRENTVRHLLDAGGKIHLGGIDPRHRGRAGGAAPGPSGYQHQQLQQQRKQQQPSAFGRYPGGAPAMKTAGAVAGHGTGMNANRVWVLEPLDDVQAALNGAPYCVSATLFDAGEQVAAAVGVPNLSSFCSARHSSQYSTDSPAEVSCCSSYGELFYAARGGGSWVCAMMATTQDSNEQQQQLQRHRYLGESIQLGAPVDITPRFSPLPHPLERLDTVVLPPPPQIHDRAPRGPRATERSLVHRGIHQTTMALTSAAPPPTLRQIAEVCFKTVHTHPSPLLRLLAVATGAANAMLDIPPPPSSAYPRHGGGGGGHQQQQQQPIWAAAGAALIAQETGAVVADADGRALDWAAGRRMAKNRGLVAFGPAKPGSSSCCASAGGALAMWRVMDLVGGVVDVERWRRKQQEWQAAKKEPWWAGGHQAWEYVPDGKSLRPVKEGLVQAGHLKPQGARCRFDCTYCAAAVEKTAKA